MTKQEAYNLDGNSPVMLADGRTGMVVLLPGGSGAMEGMCGVQMADEEKMRWIHHDELHQLKEQK